MDVRNILNYYVLKDCTRTNGTGDTINGQTVAGVQVTSPKQDDGTPATTYFGPGELVITDASGKVLDATGLTSAVQDIILHLRSVDGETTYKSKALEGKNVIGYSLKPYEAPVLQVNEIHTFDVTNDLTYIVRIRRTNAGQYGFGVNTVKSVSFTASSAATASEIANGLANEINKNFNNDTLIPIKATVTTANSILLEALDLPWELGKYKYEQVRFVVELVSFNGTVESNLEASFTDQDTTVHAQATLGNGTYKQVADIEWEAKHFSGHYDVLNGQVPVSPLKMNANSANTYDILTINWVRTQGSFSVDTQHEGDITLALPVENNATNQVADVVAALDKYIATANGVGTAVAGSLS